MTGSDPIDTVPVSDRPRRATPWTGLGIGVGLLSIVIGLLVLFWPGASVVVIAWLFAIQLIVSGILQFVAAFMDESGTGTGAHVLMGLFGAFSILVGLLCLLSGHDRARRGSGCGPAPAVGRASRPCTPPVGGDREAGRRRPGRLPCGRRTRRWRVAGSSSTSSDEDAVSFF